MKAVSMYTKIDCVAIVTIYAVAPRGENWSRLRGQVKHGSRTKWSVGNDPEVKLKYIKSHNWYC